jgi:hypothetical protein
MDHAWAAHQLKEFLQTIEDYSCLLYYQINSFGDDEVEKFDDLRERYGSAGDALDQLISRNSPARSDERSAARTWRIPGGTRRGLDVGRYCMVA